jgi:hypothetical protein
MSALLIAQQFAPLHDSHIEKVTVNGDPETRACICESIVPSAVISQIPRKVRAKKHHAAQSVSSGHAGLVLLSLGRALKSFSGALRLVAFRDSTYSFEGAPVVRRIMKVTAVPRNAATRGSRPTHGDEPTREAAMAAFAKGWRRE